VETELKLKATRLATAVAAEEAAAAAAAREVQRGRELERRLAAQKLLRQQADDAAAAIAQTTEVYMLPFSVSTLPPHTRWSSALCGGGSEALPCVCMPLRTVG